MSQTADPDDAGELRATDPRLRQLADLRAGNKAALVRLQAEGVRFSVASLRLEVLLDSIFTPDDRLVFELAYEARVAQALDVAGKQVVRAKLTQGVKPNGADLKRPPR